MIINIVIVSNGHFGDVSFFRKQIEEIKDRLIICCDGAAKSMRRAKIKPDVIIGDMDSLDAALLAKYKKEGIKIIEYPVQKDFTDTELALDYAIKQKPMKIYIWGAWGGRLDHALANLFLLRKGNKAGIKIHLIDKYGEAFLPQEEVVFTDAIGCTVSLLAISPNVEGITISGFAYALNNEALAMGETRGLSNYIKEPQARIKFISGELLVIRYWKKDIFPEVNK